MKAIWKNQILAESNDTIVIEGNHYFPPESVKTKFFVESTTHSTCPWKGLASYKSISVNGEINTDAVWFYPQPNDAAAKIKGYFAFWKGVQVKE